MFFFFQISLLYLFIFVKGLNLKYHFKNELALLKDKYGENGPEQIIVSATSSNHFHESTGFYETIRLYLGFEIPIIVCDIGLEEKERVKTKDWKNFYLLQFNYTNYPKHYKNILTYAFKPQCIHETTYINPKLIIWGDAAARFIPKTDLNELQKIIYSSRFGFASHLPSAFGHNYFQNDYNHPDSYRFLNASYTDFEGVYQFAATTLAFGFKHMNGKLMLEKWLNCAQHEECIAPEGTRVSHGCRQNQTSPNECHRFDQTAINIIFYNNFKPTKGELSNSVLILHKYIFTFHHYKPTREEFEEKIWKLQQTIYNLNSNDEINIPFKVFF